MFRLLFSTIIGLFAFAGAAVAEVSPMEISGAKTVNVTEAKALFDAGVLFIDVRKDSDWEAGRIPDAVQLELKNVFSQETLAAEVEKDTEFVFYCNGESCMRSSEASSKAVGWGYTNIHYFRDGFPSWKAANYPVE